MKAKTIVQKHAKNWETLSRAFAAGDVGIVDCRLKATGESVAVIAAFSRDQKGEYTITPFAMFFNGNPYELLEAPNPEGGYS